MLFIHVEVIKCFTVNMGRIRTKLIKKLSAEMVRKYPDKFSLDFSQNKLALDKLSLQFHIDKPMRNKIAGYIVRVIEKKS